MHGDTLADGRYHLLEVLGEGGMAKVWCAFDDRLQVHRAIKVLLPAFANRTMIRQRFLNEARTMARLHHPNIVAVHDVVEDEAVPYMVMELVRGGSLADYLEAHGPMHPRLAAEASLAVLAALELAHDEGVVHRDIKPQNILVTAKGKPKVTDFGIARLTGPNDGGPALTRTGSTLGTWGFMAPEQRSSARQADARADVYAVGATLYALVTNEIPVDLFTAELDDTRVAGISEVLEPVIRKACRYHVRDRYESSAEMAEALRALLPELEALSEETPKLGGSLGALPTPEERIQARQEGSNETLMPPPNTFRLDDSDLPPISAPDPLDADGSGTGLTRLDVPEPEQGSSRDVLIYGAAAIALLLLAWSLWPGEREVAELPPGEAEPVEITENAPPTIEAPRAPDEATTGEPTPPVEPVEEPPPSGSASPVVAAPAVPQTGGGGAEVEPPPEEPPPEEPPPEEEPVVEAPKPPPSARVRVEGDARAVVFIGSGGEVLTAGEVPPDSYTVKASFGDGSLAPAGKVELRAGQSVTVVCSSSFASCKPR